jgi:hypothetical protein
VPSLRNRSLCCRRMFFSTSARAGASVPRPHTTSPKPAAPAHSARARRRRPEAQCPAPTAAWVTTGATGDTHPSVPEGLAPSRRGIRASRGSDGALLSSLATSHPVIVAQAVRPAPRHHHGDSGGPGPRARGTVPVRCRPRANDSAWRSAGFAPGVGTSRFPGTRQAVIPALRMQAGPREFRLRPFPELLSVASDSVSALS